MNTYFRNTLLGCTIFMAALASAPAFSGGGTSVGGGGDASEGRVDEIRTDLLKWIKQGAARGLSLPERITYEVYQSSMEGILASHKVIVAFISTTQESQTTNPELKVSVLNQPKTCRGFVSRVDFMPHILCNQDRFAATSEAGQYRLIHHEYAGLAGVEQNNGPSSDYEISSQITDFLTAQPVLRLSVKRSALSDAAHRIAGDWECIQNPKWDGNVFYPGQDIIYRIAPVAYESSAFVVGCDRDLYKQNNGTCSSGSPQEWIYHSGTEHDGTFVGFCAPASGLRFYCGVGFQLAERPDKSIGALILIGDPLQTQSTSPQGPTGLVCTRL